MDLLIVLTYVALAWAVFKIFRIPVNRGRWRRRRWEACFW